MPSSRWTDATRDSPTTASLEGGPPRPSVVEILVLVLLTAVTISIRVAIAITDPGPTLFFDEAFYVENARAMAAFEAYATAHYPPVYSLLLIPGTWFDNWYGAMMASSAAFAALAVPAAWFLARSLGVRPALGAAVVAAALPAYFAYAGYLMSENASTPIFLVALALACRARGREGWLVGVTLSALGLTKYLFLPICAVLLVAYLVLLHRRNPGLGRRRRVWDYLRPIVPCVVIGAAWLAYGLASGLPVDSVLGLGVPTSTITGAAEGAPVSLLGLWAVVYLAMVVLVTLPTVFLALSYLGRRRGAKLLNPMQFAFVIILATLTVVTLAIAIQHAHGAPYNIPEPRFAWGRYFMHLTPALLILGMLLLQLLVSAPRTVRPLTVFVATGTTALLGILAWGILFKGWLFDLGAWNNRYPLTAADVFPFRSKEVLALSLAVVATLTVLILAKRAARVATLFGAVALSTALILSSAHYVASSFPRDPYTADNANLNGALPRKLFAVLADAPVAGESVFVLADGLRTRRLSWDARFWQVDPKSVSTVPVDDTPLVLDKETRRDPAALLDAVAALDECSAAAACYLVTNTPLEGGEPIVDPRWGQTTYFYRADR